jgi:hypothetical protein
MLPFSVSEGSCWRAAAGGTLQSQLMVAEFGSQPSKASTPSSTHTSEVHMQEQSLAFFTQVHTTARLLLRLGVAQADGGDGSWGVEPE